MSRIFFGKQSKTKVGVLFGFQQICVELCLPSENMTKKNVFYFKIRFFANAKYLS